MKRIVSFIVSLSLIISVLTYLPQTVSAVTSGTCGANLTWSFDSDSGTLTISGSGEMQNFPIGDNYYPITPWINYCIKTVNIENGVTSIGDNAFFDCINLTSITIPENVKYIGHSAFYDCSELTSITIENGLTAIGERAFMFCSSLRDLYIPGSVKTVGDHAFYGCSELLQIEIDEGVISIGTQSFDNCEKLEAITIPNSIEIIGDWAISESNSLQYNTFEGAEYLGNPENPFLVLICAPYNTKMINEKTKVIYSLALSGCSFESITIPNGVTSIGGSAFNYCYNLNDIYIPSSIISIGTNPFEYCQLKSIIVDENNAYYHTSGNCLIGTKSKQLISGFNNSVIPSDGSVTSIGERAFSGCYDLESIDIPDSVNYIGEYAFSNCSSLKSMVLPDNVLDLYGTFSNCNNLTTVSISGGISLIDCYSFEECCSLTDVYFRRSNFDWKDVVTSDGNEQLLNSTVHFIEEPHNHEWNEGIIAVKPTFISPGNAIYTCYGCGERKTKILEKLIPEPAGDSIEWTIDFDTGELIIGGSGEMYDFEYYSSDENFYAPWYDFRNDIKSITVLPGVTSIGNYALNGLGHLECITIPSSISRIGWLESGGLNTDRINISDLEKWYTIDFDYYRPGGTGGSMVYYPGHYYNRCKYDLYVNDKKVVNLIVPNTIGSINNYAFKGCGSIESVVIPDGISIGISTFAECAKLKEITLPKNATIARCAFLGCSELESIIIPGTDVLVGDGIFAECSSLSSVVIENGVTALPIGTFYKCSELKEINIPKSVESISEEAFYRCSNLRSITVDPDNTAYKSIDGVLFSKDGLTLCDFPSIFPQETYVIPDGVQTIQQFALINIGTLKSIYIPASVETIGWFAFANCYYLSDIYYEGTEEEWKMIEIVGIYGKEAIENARIHYNSNIKRDPGDINGDFSLNLKDILILRRVLAGLDKLNESAIKYADVNGDNEINMKDVLKLRRKVAGLE